ncbi:MAG: hypothetical protein RI897_3035 [Verrucomicrobiota bacterium]
MFPSDDSHGHFGVMFISGWVWRVAVERKRRYEIDEDGEIELESGGIAVVWGVGFMGAAVGSWW